MASKAQSTTATTTRREMSAAPGCKHLGRPCGCDTFVAFPPATANERVVIFGKNSDRPEGEGQSIRRYPRIENPTEKEVKCTYITIPQASSVNAVLLSQIDWMWGAEMGANEHGVVIGNEAVWTREPCSGERKYLLGMDLVRLGLERGNTAKEAMTVITNLLEEYGQGGPCAQDDPSFTYHNSYLFVDQREAWVLETAGRHWVAERITYGVRNISNCLTIRTKYDLCSKGIVEYAREKGYWTEEEPARDATIDFAKAFCTGSVSEEITDPRFCDGKRLLQQHSNKLDKGNGTDSGGITKDSMIAILRDHSSGICMHGGFETTSSWVSEIYVNDGNKQNVARHWATGKPYPCQNPFEEYKVVDGSSN